MAIGRPIEQTPNIADKVVTATATAGQTQFTVTGGYRINHLAVFRNGVRLVNGNDYTALDGSTITLMEDASNLDVLEFQVFDTFNVSDALLTNAASQTVNGDVTVTGTFTVGTGGIGTFVAAEVNVGIVSSNTGITTVQSLQASSSTTTGALQVKGGVGIGKSLYVGGNVSVGGTLTYEDVTNVDSVGVVTAGKGVRITTGGLVVTAGVSTFAGITTVTNTAALHSKQLNVSAGSTFGGAVTASDNLTVGDTLYLADQIVHTGDTNTKIRFPAADIITAETAGSEALRIDSSQNFGVGTASPTARLDVRRGDADGKIAEFHQSTGFGIDIGSSAALAYIASGYNQNWAFKTDAGSGQVERLRIDSSGRLLLGTTTEGEATADNLTIADSGHCGITLRSGTSSVGTLFFSDSTSGTGEYEGYVQYDHGSNFLKFATNASEKIRVGWGGTVSISQSDHAGAQTLGADLVVADTTGASIIVGDTGSGEYLYLAGDGGIGKVGMKSNHDLAFFTNGITGGSERLRITAGGYVGIGTQIPDKTGIQNGVKVLEISGGDGGELIMGNHASHNVSSGMHVGSLAFKNIDSSTGSVPHYAGIRCKTSDTVGNMDLRFYTGINNLETDNPQVLINSTGLVGIGTNIPLNNLHLHSSTSGVGPILQMSNNTGDCRLFFGTHSTTADANAQGQIRYNVANNYLAAYTTGAERARIESSGKLLIERTVSDTSGDHPALQVKTTSSGTENASFATGIDFFQDSIHKKRLAITKGNAGTGGGDWIFYENNGTTRQLELIDGGNVEISDGNLVIGTNGHGIDFSVTESSNTTESSVLADYEEGTFSPHLQGYYNGAWTNVTFSSVSRYGRYIKIGNLVHVQIYFSNFHIDSQFDSTLGRIGSLPFSAGPADNTGYGLLSYAHGTAFESNGMFFYTNAGAATAASVKENNTDYNSWSGSSGRYLMAAGSYKAL